MAADQGSEVRGPAQGHLVRGLFQGLWCKSRRVRHAPGLFTCVPRDTKSSACLMLQGLCWALHGWTNHRVGPRIVYGEVVTDFELTQCLNVYVL